MATPTPQEIMRVKALGFLHNRGTDTFSARAVNKNGTLTAQQLKSLAECAEKYGNGQVAITSRLQVEMPGIHLEDVEAVRQFAVDAGLVIGGTHIEEAAEIRARYKNTFFLIPGYGAQGGTAADIAQYLTAGNGGVVNSSRGILLAYKKQEGVRFDEAAYRECVDMKGAIADACAKL